jgi:hypothetical protein
MCALELHKLVALRALRNDKFGTVCRLKAFVLPDVSVKQAGSRMTGSVGDHVGMQQGFQHSEAQCMARIGSWTTCANHMR